MYYTQWLDTAKTPTKQQANTMAKTKLYQLYDNEAETVVGPIAADLRHPSAIRNFYEVLGDPTTYPSKYPQHFDLRHIGVQETTTGEITPCKPEVIARGSTWQEAKRAMEARGETGNPVQQLTLADDRGAQVGGLITE